MNARHVPLDAVTRVQCELEGKAANARSAAWDYEPNELGYAAYTGMERAYTYAARLVGGLTALAAEYEVEIPPMMPEPGASS